MVGIILVSHGLMAQGMKQSCEMIAGKRENIHALALTEEGIVPFENKLSQLVTKLKSQYKDILILTDLVNATPFLQAYRLTSKDKRIKLVSGMNLPTLLAFALAPENYDDFDGFVRERVNEQAYSVALFEPSVSEEDEQEL